MLWMQKALWWYSHCTEGKGTAALELLASSSNKAFFFFLFFSPPHTVTLRFCVLLEQIAEIFIPFFLTPLLFSSESLLYFGCVPKQSCDIFWFKNSNWGKKRRSEVCFSLVLLSKSLEGLVESTAMQTLNQQNGTDGDPWRTHGN